MHRCLASGLRPEFTLGTEPTSSDIALLRAADPAAPAVHSTAVPGLRDVGELLPAALYTCDAPAGRITYFNANAVRLWGRAPQLDETDERFCGSFRLWRSDGTLLPHDQTPMAQAVVEGRAARNEQVVIERPDGSRVAVVVNIDPIFDDAGRIVGAINIFHDTMTLKQTAEARSVLAGIVDSSLAKLSDASTRLWRSHSLAQGLDEMLVTVIELLGADLGNIQLLNPQGDVLSILSQRGFEQGFLDIFREVTAANDSACGRALRTGERVIIEDVEVDAGYASYCETARRAGYRSVVTTPLIGVEGRPLGMISTHFRTPHRPTDQELRRLDLYCRQASDFIQRFKLEETLRRSEEALREADRRKDEFLALLAHELRNPLAPIRYALAATRKPGRTADQRKRAEEIIERQVAHMSRLLDDLLDISRITRGSLELKLNRTELTTVIGAAIEAARPVLDSKQHNLSLVLPKEAVRLEADAVRLAQVFSNLLINAAKYTDAGGQIELRAVQEQGDIVISVRDNGIGIAPEMMPRMFTLFAQAHTALDRSEGGLGVGLALVRGLVELHGGLIEVHSEGPGRGSEFTVRLPLDLPATEFDDDGAAGIGLRGGSALKVLVVDDNIDAADSCCTLLELSGHEVQTAYAGTRALELAESFRPDVLLLDIGLPDINGYEVARKIRSAPWGRHTSLVAVTGWGQDEDRRRAFEAGFDHHLTKPLAADAMETLLGSLGAAPTDSGRSHTATR